MSNISKKAFSSGFTTGNENADHFIKASTSGKLEPDANRDLAEFLDITSVKLAKAEVPLFTINDEINDLLKNTENKSHYRPLPFKEMFIDITDLCDSGEALKPHDSNGKIVETKGIECKQISTCGFYLVDLGDCITVTSPIRTIWGAEKNGKYTKILGEGNNDLYSFWDSVIGKNITRDKNQKHLIPKGIKKKYKEYICNLLDFINHQDVEFVCSESHTRNDLRVKRGKSPLFTKYHIVIKGKLKRYINKTMQQNEKAWELGHRFWVRGHWKHFESDRYKNKKGQKTWVLPYIKGRGELIKKDYYIGEKEQCWENEKQMIKIIREMYPNKEIQTHNRTTLNGLEIDCYVPELKLGFEYNGLQHYEHVEIFHKTKQDFEAQKARDVEKLKRAAEKGIKIITIRYDEPVTEQTIRSKLE